MNKKSIVKEIKNKKLLNESLELCLKSFKFQNNKNRKASFKYRWFNDPSQKACKVFGILDKGKIIAGIRIISREIFFENQKFNFIGITETFVKDTYLGLGYAKILTNFIINKYQNKKYIFLIIIASKKIDRFYLDYKGFGIDSYDTFKLTIEKTTISKNIKFKKINKKDLKKVMNIYNYSYRNTIGKINRNIYYWKFIFNLKKYNKNKFIKILYNKKIIGYFVLKNEIVIEIGILNQIYIKMILYKLLKFLKKKNKLSLNIPVQHSVLDSNLKYDITHSRRECYYGGHVVKLLNVEKIIRLKKIKIQKILNQFKISSLSYKFGKIKIECKNRKAKIFFPNTRNITYNELNFLLDNNTIYSKNLFLQKTINSFFISKLDEY